MLHTHRAWRLRSALLRYGGSQVIVINIPWYLKEPQIEAALSEESDAAASTSKGGRHKAPLTNSQIEP